MVRPLPGFALCGGGAVTHYWYGMLIWALEPTTKPDPITELDQSFTGRSVFGTNKNDNSSITAYAMGIKLYQRQGLDRESSVIYQYLSQTAHPM